METHQIFLLALGIVFVIEGTPYAFFPSGIKRMLAQLMLLPDRVLRVFGFVILGLGFSLVLFAKSL